MTPDEARPLTPKGHKQVQRVARFCQRHALLPSHLLCSPLVRALETALQADLRIYTGMLGEMAGVEDDLVLLEQVGSEN
ncbi:SixA phosphatase family protein [Thiothrix unzii]|uniref:SixA phosphatase family protein n=1 Tax=Thiothrix unzii TaxID=111769 RepID=UPI00387E10F2